MIYLKHRYNFLCFFFFSYGLFHCLWCCLCHWLLLLSERRKNILLLECTQSCAISLSARSGHWIRECLCTSTLKQILHTWIGAVNNRDVTLECKAQSFKLAKSELWTVSFSLGYCFGYCLADHLSFLFSLYLFKNDERHVRGIVKKRQEDCFSQEKLYLRAGCVIYHNGI